MDVFLLLVRDDQVLLALRAGTGFADGWWNLPSGKLEQDEDAASALVREAREETGLVLDRARLTLTATVHSRNHRGIARLGLFFRPASWPGEPVNAEPHKCAGIAWFPLGALPARTYASSRTGIELFRRGENFAAVGW
ncbi:NUDIX domain-containing protein [Frankia sp. QA3]|uniref:NUDIX hydrolase n=1 Tax=Frankia sp. QA3 TaxID=710111 RepID=UPI001E5D955D|nr:NUDIX domain-containing protein [Frankia sp. QA3]